MKYLILRILSGILFLLAALYLPPFISHEVLPDGWIRETLWGMEGAYWWSIPTYVLLGISHILFLAAGILMFIDPKKIFR